MTESRDNERYAAEVFVDHQHGPGIRVRIGNVTLSVYLYDETGIVTRSDGQFGIEVTGPWHEFRDLTRQVCEFSQL